MKQMKKVLALVLALALLLAFTACGKDGEKKSKSGKTTAAGGSSTTATTTTTTTTTTTIDDGGLLPDDERDGSAELPFEIGGVLEFDAVVKAGGETHYDVYRVGGTTLTIESKDAYVVYEGKTYEPTGGIIAFPVTTDDINNPVKLAIGNKGTADATFKVTFTYPEGTKSNPIELKEGDLVTVLKAGDEDGLVYLFTATEAGTLTVVDKSVTKGDGYDIALFNLATSASRTLEEDGVEKEGVRMVSVEVSKGDKVEVTIAALPNDKNEYPAVTLKTQVAFSKGTAQDEPVEKWLDFTVTVKDQDGNPVPGVKVNISSEMIGDTVTTDSKGVAKVHLPEGVPTGTIEVPKGYIAAANKFTFAAGTTSLTITLEKEQPITPPAPPVDPEDPEVTTMDYTVTLLDGSGNPMGGATVSFYAGDKQVAQQTADKKGVVKVTLDRGTYTLKVGGTALSYDEKAAVVSVNKPALTLILAADIDTSKTLKINDPLIDKDIAVYYLPEGAVYVDLAAGERNYFLFEPTRAGTYRFAASNTYAKIGHFGTDMFVFPNNVAENISGNAFNISVSEGQIGNVFVIGIDAATNCTAAVLQVTRIGDPAWDVNEEPWVDYAGSGTPAKFTYTGGGTLTNCDISASAEYQIVYNSTDGYYHLNSQNGPVVYVRLGAKAPYVSIQSLLAEFGNMGVFLYNDDGTFLRKEQYAGLMQEYVNNMDAAQGVYPLTKDLEYMIRNYGDAQNWWNEGQPGYLFEEVSGVNPANAWTFLFCYKK